MHIYLLNMVMIYIESFITKIKNSGSTYKKCFCILVSLQFILISGLRGLNIGADTPVYKELFDYYHSISWSEMFEYLISMFTQSGIYESRDMLYYFFTKVFAAILPSFRLFLFFVIIVFMIGFSRFIYCYSSDLCLSYLVFASWMFAFFGLTGIRQTFAVILCVFIGFELIQKRKFLPFLLVVLLSSMVHKTSLVVLPFYFVYNFKITKFYKAAVPIIFAAVFLIKDKLILYLTNGTYAIYVSSTDQAPYNLTMIVTLIVFVSLLLYEKMAAKNKMVHIYINAVVLGMFILELSLSIPILVRLSYYYIMFLVLLIPEMLKAFDKRGRTILQPVFCIVLMLLTMKTNQYYEFMWQ